MTPLICIYGVKMIHVLRRGKSRYLLFAVLLLVLLTAILDDPSKHFDHHPPTMIITFPARSLMATLTPQNYATGTLTSGMNFTRGNNTLCLHTLPMGGRHGIIKRTKKNMAIWVTSARNHFERRHLIRKTWGSIKKYGGWTISPLIFVIGSHGDDEEADDLPKKLEIEQEKFADLLIGDFKDTYINLSIKSAFAYEFFATFCPGIQILVKTDDDILLNIYQLTRDLNNELPGITQTSTFYCCSYSRARPYRNKKDKWYVSKEEYPKKFYPTYCNGPGYVVTMGSVRKISGILMKTNITDYFRMEDVFMTGILRTKFNQQIFLKKEAPSPNNARELITIVNKRSKWYSWAASVTDGKEEMLTRWVNLGQPDDARRGEEVNGTNFTKKKDWGQGSKNILSQSSFSLSRVGPHDSPKTFNLFGTK